MFYWGVSVERCKHHSAQFASADQTRVFALVSVKRSALGHTVKIFI